MSQSQFADPIAEWDAAVAAEMREKRLSKANAVRAVAIAQPDLQKAYIAAYTQLHGENVRRPNR